MRHALIRPATAPLPMPRPCYALACALAGALAAFALAYATLAHFNTPLPPTGNVAHYSKHQHRIAPHMQPSANAFKN